MADMESDVTAVSREVMFASQKDHNFVPIDDSTERLDEEKGDSSRSGLGSNSPEIWVPPNDVYTSDQSEILTIKGDRKVKSGDVTAVSREVMFASQKDHNFVPIADSTERLDEEKGDSSRSGLGSNSPDIWVPPIDVNTSDQSEILTIKGDRKVKSGDEADSLSKEETNFVRFFLCLKIGFLAVRNLFDRNVPVHTLDSFLRQHKRALTYPRSICRCTIEQEAKLFHGGQVVDSKDFDFSLLYRLIKNFVIIPPPTSGWGNQPLNETDDIERIRYFRHFLAHISKFEICDMDFFTYWSDLSQVIARLSKSGLSTDVESLRTKTFDKCIKHEMEEIQNELNEMRKEMREECMEQNQDVTDYRPDIAHNRQNIHNFNTRQNKPICITEEENKTEMLVMPTGNGKNLDHLCHGCFEITSLAYRMSTVFMSVFSGAWLRWSNDNSKFTTFTFRKTIEAGKTYFHIFSADYPDYYVTMGMFSWYVRCTQGDPTGCIDGTWEIKCLEYNNDVYYVLCTKDGNYLSAGSTRRMHGKRGDINERRMFFIRKRN